MKNIIYILVLTTLGSLSCNRESSTDSTNTCSVSNPVEDLPWLKTKVQELEKNKADTTYPYFYVLQASLENKTVFIFDNCCPMCNTIIPVYSCDGELLFHTNEDLERAKKIGSKKLVWKPQGFSCTIE